MQSVDVLNSDTTPSPPLSHVASAEIPPDTSHVPRLGRRKSNTGTRGGVASHAYPLAFARVPPWTKLPVPVGGVNGPSNTAYELQNTLPTTGKQPGLTIVTEEDEGGPVQLGLLYAVEFHAVALTNASREEEEAPVFRQPYPPACDWMESGMVQVESSQ